MSKPNTSLSVLTAVYSGDTCDHIDQCFESIRKQSLQPDQLVVVVDGPVSSDHEAVLDKYARVFQTFDVVRLPINQGLGHALNAGLSLCTGELIARIDVDDVCASNRLSQQVEHFLENPDIVVSSGAIAECDELLNRVLHVRSLPLQHRTILRMARGRNPMNHMAVMFRRQSVEDVGGYPPFRKAQDYALWSKMLNMGYKMSNISKVLVYARTGRGLWARRGWKYFRHELKIIRFQYQIGFINIIDYMINIGKRATFRLPPPAVRAALYRLLRVFGEHKRRLG